jgi:hypothetical protein
MSLSTIHHPTEEALVDCALHESDEKLLAHIEECTQCSEFVEEIRMVTRDIAAIDDEPVPERVNAAILAISRSKRPGNFLFTFIQNWYRNPFLIGLATIGLILLLYAVLVLHL